MSPACAGQGTNGCFLVPKQSEDDLDLVCSVVLSSGQAVQFVWPGWSWYKPFSHGEHAPVLLFRNVPVLHSTAMEDPETPQLQARSLELPLHPRNHRCVEMHPEKCSFSVGESVRRQSFPHPRAAAAVAGPLAGSDTFSEVQF